MRLWGSAILLPHLYLSNSTQKGALFNKLCSILNILAIKTLICLLQFGNRHTVWSPSTVLLMSYCSPYCLCINKKWISISHIYKYTNILEKMSQFTTAISYFLQEAKNRKTSSLNSKQERRGKERKKQEMKVQMQCLTVCVMCVFQRHTK